MIITIAGNPGSGKSTLAQKLAKRLGYKLYSIGGMRREIAEKKGITLAEFNKLGEKDFSTDKEVDEFQKKLGKEQNNIIVEGRTSFYFIPHSLKIFLHTDEKEAARRILKDLQEKKRGVEAKGLLTFKDVLKSIRERVKSDKFRYKKYYNLDVCNPKYFDLFLDTTKLTEGEVLEAVYKFVKSFLDNQKKK